jgi:putative transposase
VQEDLTTRSSCRMEACKFQIQFPGTPYLIIDNAAMEICYFSMARIGRVIVPGLPHHITQRGNRRQETFFIDDDYQEYLHLMAKTQSLSMLSLCQLWFGT